MASSIGRSITQGFQAANRGWAGMGVYAAGWVLIFAVAVVGLMASGVPQEALQNPGAALPAVPAAQPAPMPAADQAVADGAPAPSDDAQAAMADWAGRSWPVLLLIALVAIIASTWLYAGQIAFLAALVRGQAATVATFLAGAKASFVRLLLTSLLMFGAIAVAGLAVVLAGLLLGALPGAVAGVLGALLLTAGTIAMVWLMVRAAFWFIAVVVDGQRPVAAFKASLAVTRGKWLKTFGFIAALFGLALAALAVFNVLGQVAKLIGGPGGLAFVALVTVVQVAVLNLYFGFAFVAASVRFYEDAKTPA